MSLSPFNSSLTLSGLKTRPENKYLERKGRGSKPTKIANELIGMLNAGGGVLVYGISDEGEIEDLRETDETRPNDTSHLDPYRKLVHEFITPPANIELEEITLEGGALIFLYHAEPDFERLFQRKDNEEVYLRVAETNRKLSRDEVKKLEYNKAIRSFEEEPRLDFDPEDFESAVCEQYRKAMSYDGTFEALALKRNLAIQQNGKVVFKNAAILLFATDPEKYIANAVARYVRYQGTERKSGDKFNVVKDQRFETNIPGLIRELTAFIEASLRDYYYLDFAEGKFRKVPEFPKDAWLEGIVNAVCHRSYNLTGNPILIRHFDDRLEIANSGPLPAQVTVENIGRERYSRNPRIARVLADLGYVRELNEGVPRIFSAMAEFTLAEPEYTNSDATVTLTLKNKVSGHKETIFSDTLELIESHWPTLNANQHKIIEFLFSEQEATVSALIAHAAIGEKAVRNNLKKLDNLKITERVSDMIRDPNAIYRFRNG